MKKTLRISLTACFLLMTGLFRASQAQEQHADHLMKALGFHKSGTEFLYPIPFFRYACSSRQYKPYLVVPESSLEGCRLLNDSGKLAYLAKPDLEWRILLPVTREIQSSPVILMKGRSVVDDQGWQQLGSCLLIGQEGKLSLQDTTHEQELLQEAFTAWQELIDWYKTGIR